MKLLSRTGYVDVQKSLVGKIDSVYISSKVHCSCPGWFESLRQNPLDSLTLPTMLVNDDNAEVYENHCGQVLVPLSIMKCDYFRGCQVGALQSRWVRAAKMDSLAAEHEFEPEDRRCTKLSRSRVLVRAWHRGSD